jgi:hypothetical protein
MFIGSDARKVATVPRCEMMPSETGFLMSGEVD